jgi:hypothetical protein
MRTYISGTHHIGFWSACLSALWAGWFSVAFFIWYLVCPPPGVWPGLKAYAASFQSGPFLAWVVPCLLLTLTFPLLMASVYQRAPVERKMWALAGFVFAVIYGAILGCNYWIQLAVVSPALVDGRFEGLEPFVIGSPNSIAFSLEGLGYSLMGLAMLFSGTVFSGGSIERWIRALFIINGIQVAALIAAFLGVWVFTMAALAVWCVTFPVVCVLLARFFRKKPGVM